MYEAGFENSELPDSRYNAFSTSPPAPWSESGDDRKGSLLGKRWWGDVCRGMCLAKEKGHFRKEGVMKRGWGKLLRSGR